MQNTCFYHSAFTSTDNFNRSSLVIQDTLAKERLSDKQGNTYQPKYKYIKVFFSFCSLFLNVSRNSDLALKYPTSS